MTEGTSSNAWIVTRDGAIVTRDLSQAILHGITRAAVLRARPRGADARRGAPPSPSPRPRRAAEAFITAASAYVTPVVEIDGAAIGDGRPGPLTRRLRELYLAESRRTAT